MQPDDDRTEDPKELVGVIEAAGIAFSRALAQVSYANGDVAWPREITLAQQRVDEAVMWAVKAVTRNRQCWAPEPSGSPPAAARAASPLR
jgi:hypothetical protein